MLPRSISSQNSIGPISSYPLVSNQELALHKHDFQPRYQGRDRPYEGHCSIMTSLALIFHNITNCWQLNILDSSYFSDKHPFNQQPLIATQRSNYSPPHVSSLIASTVQQFRMSSTTSSSPSSTTTQVTGQAQGSQGISLVAFITALTTSLVVFGIQIFAFLLLRNKLARIL